jgi:hypothetical protein
VGRGFAGRLEFPDQDASSCTWDGFSRASSTAAAINPSALFGIYRWGWGFSTSQDFNGDIALVACFASSWTPAMVRRWHADPFGFLRPWGEVR